MGSSDTEETEAANIGEHVNRPQRLRSNHDIFRDFFWTTLSGEDVNNVPIHFHFQGQGCPQSLVNATSDDCLVVHFCSVAEALLDATRRATLQKKRLVHRNVEIVDMDGEGVSGYLSRGRGAVRAMETVTKVMDRYYPERICKVYIVNVPRIFYMIWSIVKRMVPETTLRKLEIFADSEAERRRFLDMIGPHCSIDQVRHVAHGAM